MAPRTNKTSAVVLPAEQWELLKTVALTRTLRGQMVKASVSEVLREIVAEATPALEKEINSSEKGTQ
ncbi:hypothetical protein [Aureimonas psammosilenae]|uniref:hypothetical protein n=1 Tax=Aureimonas psammosilenae TaxID=2495496 RepID=UPI0012605EE1|nr:hypothetical protein [Aureimonas psammosilenae]